MSDTLHPIRERIDSGASLEAGIDRILLLAGQQILVFAGSLGPAWNQISRVRVLRRFCLETRRGRIRFLLHDPRPAYGECPRLLALLRQFSHLMEVHETPYQAKAVYDPFVITDHRHYVHRFHVSRGLGVLGINDPAGAQALSDRFEAMWLESDQAVSATTLGL